MPPTGTFLGGGSFGKVYGPFPKHIMNYFLDWLYPRAIRPTFHEDEKYVLKFVEMNMMNFEKYTKRHFDYVPPSQNYPLEFFNILFIFCSWDR
jgi:hypothetical protein